MDGSEVLWIGETKGDAFRDAYRTARERLSVTDVADLDSAQALLARRQGADDYVEPAWIVIAQSRPGEIDRDAVANLRHAAPLARVIALLGPWCDGEARSGSPWPADVRVAWHDGPAFVVRHGDDASHGASLFDALPATASDEERWLLAASQAAETPHDGNAVAVAARDRVVARWLADECAAAGYQAIVFNSLEAFVDRAVSLAIWDADALDAAARERLREFAAAVQPAPVIVLLSFPREADVADATAAGAAVVLAKPLLPGEPAATLDRLARRGLYYDPSSRSAQSSPAPPG